MVGPSGELESLGVVAQRIVGSQAAERGIARLPRVVDGLVQVDGLGSGHPMTGQLADPGPRVGATQVLECLGHPFVAPGPTGGAHVDVERVLDERVGEVVAPGHPGQLVDEVDGGGRVEDVEEIVLGDLGGPGQHIEVEVPPDHRRSRKHALGLLPEPADPGADHLADAVGQRRVTEVGDRRPMSGVVLVDLPGLVQVAEHLAHEERIAVRLPAQGSSQAGAGVVEGVTCGRLHQRDHARLIEPGQIDAGDARLPAEGGKRFEQRMGPGEPAVPVGGEDEHPQRLLGRAQVTQQLQAGAVRPLEVVQDEYHRLGTRDHGQEADDGGKEHVALGVGLGGSRGREVREPAPEGRDQAGQFAPVFRHMVEELLLTGVGHVVGERLAEELIRGGQVLLAVPEQHARTLIERGLRRSGQQRGLAHAGLSRDQQDLASLTTVDPFIGAGQLSDFVLAADHSHRGACAQAPGQGHVGADRPVDRLPCHLDGLHRLGKALQLPEALPGCMRAGSGGRPSGEPCPWPGSGPPCRRRTARSPRSPGRRSARRARCSPHPRSTPPGDPGRAGCHDPRARCPAAWRRHTRWPPTSRGTRP